MTFISCDAEAYSGSLGGLGVGPLDIAAVAVNQNTDAVIFYSESSNFCIPQPPSTINLAYTFTMQNNTHTLSFLAQLRTTSNMGKSHAVLGGSLPVAPTNITNTPPDNSNSNSNGAVSGTAVAMIVLYAITGLITVLFICIIITGAVRAQRHPERYGPRGPNGRRQTRAGGLARAMLETIPIVKFGEREPAKTADVEMVTPGPDQAQPSGFVEKVGASTETQEVRPSSSERANGEDITAVGGSSAVAQEENQGCSICTDDFEIGQDQRILPCNHAFHPACIDPWLLNVSGTCPLCRIDLRPGQNSDANENHGASSNDDPTSLPPPIADDVGNRTSRRRSTLLSMTGLRRADGMTREERLAALRQLRVAQSTEPAVFRESDTVAGASPTDEVAAPEERERRFRQRLVRLFNIRTRQVQS